MQPSILSPCPDQPGRFYGPLFTKVRQEKLLDIEYSPTMTEPIRLSRANTDIDLEDMSTQTQSWFFQRKNQKLAGKIAANARVAVSCYPLTAVL